MKEVHGGKIERFSCPSFHIRKDFSKPCTGCSSVDWRKARELNIEILKRVQ
jgi:hypothetical protein